MAKKVKLQHLTVLLLSPTVAKWEDALKTTAGLDDYALQPQIGFDGHLYVKRNKRKPVGWYRFVASGVAGLPKLEVASISAVLFISASKRRFAITFGFGRTLLAPDAYERDFGLKVVLNTVDPENLRSVDLHAFEEFSVHTRKQVSRGSPIHVFGMDSTQDLLRAVIGKPRDPNFAEVVAGSDAVTINSRVTFADLQKKCSELLTAYQSKAYKADFGFVDQIRAVKQPGLVATLDNLHVDVLKKKDFDKIHLAPPKITEWDNIESFTYVSAGTESAFPDLDAAEYVSTLKALPALTIQDLKKEHTIGVTLAGATSFADIWRIYDCAVCEVEHNSQAYVLTNSEWYAISKDLCADVEKKMKAFPKSALVLDDAKAGQSEGSYNKAVSKKLGYGLLDTKNIKVSGRSTPIEACDLVTPNGQFLHVKRKTRSSTLSHLFAQGTVAADAFFLDSEFRDGMRSKLTKKWPAIAKAIPVAKPDPTKHEIVYAIICPAPKKPWPTSLPFFSQLNLTHAQRRLDRLGYKVSLLRIHQK